MKHRQYSSESLFKGIALFTPGGDMVYCVDPHKQGRWHLQFCAVFQDALRLPEPPHFLVPCYTATVDRWVDATTQQIRVAAEASPLVLQHQALLSAVFELDNLDWQPNRSLHQACNPLLMSHFRERFPALWVNHDLVIRADRPHAAVQTHQPNPGEILMTPVDAEPEPKGYVLRLFISGQGAATERILKRLHETLEQYLQEPYTLKVIDIYKNPEQAETNQITATPTLVKVWPPPVKKVVGDLHDTGALLSVLISPKALETDAEF